MKRNPRWRPAFVHYMTPPLEVIVYRDNTGWEWYACLPGGKQIKNPSNVFCTANLAMQAAEQWLCDHPVTIVDDKWHFS